MIRIEFCNILTEKRRASNSKMKDICFALETMPTTVYRIENGSNNFNLVVALKYLNAIQHVLKLNASDNQKHYTIKKYADFISFLKNTRANITQRDLANMADCSCAVIANVEQERNIISIDIFLKIVDALDYTIDIKAVKTS